MAIHTAGQSPRTRSALPCINWYINGYGPPWTSSDPNLTPDHGRICTWWGVLHATTDQKALPPPLPGPKPRRPSLGRDPGLVFGFICFPSTFIGVGISADDASYRRVHAYRD